MPKDIKRWIGPWAGAQILSAGFLFYGAGIVLAAFMKRGVGLIAIILFTVLVSIGFSYLTRIWFRLRATKRSIPRPEFNLILGVLIFMPLYFLLAYYSGPFSYGVQNLVWLYVMLPVSVTLIGTQTGTLGGLVLAIFVTLTTGHRLSKPADGD